jgi:hypothetical protein
MRKYLHQLPGFQEAIYISCTAPPTRIFLHYCCNTKERRTAAMTKQDKSTRLFIGFLLLAGVANLFSRTAVPELDTLATCINYLILIGLLLFWI